MNAVVFWQNIPSIHQAGLLRRLAARCNDEVIVVTEADVSPQRRCLGWTQPNLSPARLILAPSETERAELVKLYAKPGAVHIFSGLSGFPSIYEMLKAVSRTEATIGAYLEQGRQDDGMRAVVRRLHYIWLGLIWRRRLDFILGVGALAERYYSDCGFPRQRIFPFGYFVEPFDRKEGERPNNGQVNATGETVRLLFAGEVVWHKGLDILLGALHNLLHLPWRLDIVGGGSDTERVGRLSRTLGLANRIGWLGVMSNDAVRSKMQMADVLVLPSRHDGWGVVVNEALLAGTRVVASDACGASELLHESSRGGVFRSECVSHLRDVLAPFIQQGQLSKENRNCIRKWAEAVLTPNAASGYLAKVIEYVRGGSTQRPIAPWRASSSQLLEKTRQGTAAPV
jgi:glycosyltransferase involved in cell wall biosynthesis